MSKCNEMHARWVEWIDTYEMPPSVWMKDADSVDGVTIVTILAPLNFSKWLCLDEDGQEVVCAEEHLKGDFVVAGQTGWF